MPRFLAAAGTLTLSFAAACASGGSAAGSPAGASPTPAGAPSGASSTAGMRTMSANVVSTGATSARMSGSITLTPLDANTYSVTIEFRGAPSSRTLPWAIRPGACGDVTPNTDIGGRSAYGPIQTQADGQSHVNTRVRVQLPVQQTLRVDIMASNSQRDVVLACGLLLGR